MRTFYTLSKVQRPIRHNIENSKTHYDRHQFISSKKTYNLTQDVYVYTNQKFLRPMFRETLAKLFFFFFFFKDKRKPRPILKDLK